MFFFLFFLLPQLTYSNSLPCLSSCGKITNITHPFRLKQDPTHCGNSKYELDCVNNVAILSLYDGYYFVESINYNNYTIRVVDPNIQPTNCSSLPRFFLYRFNFSFQGSYGQFISKESSSYQYSINRSSSTVLGNIVEYDFTKSTYIGHYNEYDLSIPVIYMKCSSPSSKFEDKYYVDATSCLGQDTYAIVGDPPFEILDPQCRINLVTLTSFWGSSVLYGDCSKIIGNISYVDIHEALRYGFEISWMKASCPCNECLLNDTINEVQCSETICSFDSCGYWADKLRQMFAYVTGIDEVPFVGLILVILILTTCLRVYNYFKMKGEDETRIEKFLEEYRALNPARFSYADIKRITNNFREKLGEGAHGSVFKGKLSNEIFVAVKMLNNTESDGKEFINEVKAMGKVHHINVVRLLGFCADGCYRALVYNFFSNGSLQNFITRPDEKDRFLGWEKLHQIAIGIAKGIEYLHMSCDQQILHFDINPHNVLLDDKLLPKITDFGLAKLCAKDQSAVSVTAARGTLGYIAPEVFSRNFGNITYKADIYSYGMLLLEMVGGRKNISQLSEENSQVLYPEWIHNLFEGKDMQVKIEGVENDMILKKLAIIGLWCLQWHAINRPSIKVVLRMLEALEDEDLVVPPNPISSNTFEVAKIPTKYSTLELESIHE